jgi:hypothetical protein
MTIKSTAPTYKVGDRAQPATTWFKGKIFVFIAPSAGRGLRDKLFRVRDDLLESETSLRILT